MLRKVCGEYTTARPGSVNMKRSGKELHYLGFEGTVSIGVSLSRER